MAKQGTLLVVDDNRNILTSLQYLLEEYFQQVITLNSPVTIPSLLQREAIDVVLLDMNFSSGINSGNEGLYWLREIKRLRPQIQVVLFTAYADINLAVTGLKDGATDFIVKPWDNAKLVQTLQEAYAKARGNEKKGKQSSQLTEKSSMYWGNSSVIRPLRLLVEKVSTTDANILITGENGTGKDMLAREIHRLSPRRNGPMVAVEVAHRLVQQHEIRRLTKHPNESHALLLPEGEFRHRSFPILGNTQRLEQPGNLRLGAAAR